ncbi:hypothetical protein H5T55_02965 [Candidatus Bipolaricaulota bacterium]|nr:hypothetical protein [Candidatus Bipolaricaulota bacterium]
MRTKTVIGLAVAIVGVALLVVVLWPAPDPLARVETVAIRPPDWEKEPANPAVRVPFMDGLTVTLGERNIRIVADPQAADAILVVRDIRVESLEFRLESGQLTGRVSATCVLTEVRTGETRIMDFALEIKDGGVRATLVARKFWQFWKRG